ncbi:hypothetical protein AMATHDRAFT_134263 [Amanita thiersii Skay4041]|uniref:Exocyst complex component Sec8 n=1 Tax=Amanita thiersii Skay4041 TaxID=703135 RepID=A0A2A9NX81_9AGAR|nr:hypothetical protein AMATHDRAFT_134263 [Amanita thiersii Skay4041]
MSRVPPFPSRPRSPPTTPHSSSATSSTRPLQITRPPSRPATPNAHPVVSTTPRHTPTTAPLGPSRPQRSELRNRPHEHTSFERTSTVSHDPVRDSTSTTRSDPFLNQKNSPVNVSGNAIPPSRSRSRPRPFPNAASPDEETTTPTPLVSAVSAFQSAGSRRRAMTNDSEDLEYEKERQHEMENERRRQQRIREKVPGRKPTGKARAGDIDAVLDQVKDGWEFIVDPDFNCVDLALQLLDESANGKDMVSFRQTKDMLSRTLKGSVDKYYQAFAASLPHHTSLLNHLTGIQVQLSNTRASLSSAKEALGSKRSDLVQLWSRGHMLEEMIRLLDQIEYLKSVPDLLETLISEKRLLQASVLLVKSMKLINKPEMLGVGAVADLRTYLIGQEMSSRDILIDELQNHLYLKSFWCESRWAAYIPNRKIYSMEDYIDSDTKSTILSQVLPSTAHKLQNKLQRFINDMALRPNDPPHDLGEPELRITGLGNVALLFANGSMPHSELNPEADSFAYIETLLEALAVLGKLGAALDTITQRLPGEIFSLVEITVDEVEERAVHSRRTSMLDIGVRRSTDIYVLAGSEHLVHIDYSSDNRPVMKSSQLRLASLESSVKMTDHEILKDFFWTLYSKLDAVVQGLRVISEVANRIGSRRDFRDSSGTKPGALFPLDEVWNSIQVEVHNLIRDYLTDEEKGSATGRHPILSINEVLREGKLVRDKAKKVFRFTDTDLKLVNKSLKVHEDGLTHVLRDTMPGLAPGSSDTIHSAIFTMGSDDRLLNNDQHHRLLIKPDAFHVTVLFQPTLSFLDRIVNILPMGVESARTSSELLDDFVLRVYLPQLEEKVSDLFHQAVTGPDAFHPDPFSLRLSREPLVQASTKLMALINSLCAMLCTSPFHRENYSRLILSVIIQFYQRCSDRFQDLVSISDRGDSFNEGRLTISAQWSQRSELTSCLGELLSTPDNDHDGQRRTCSRETDVEMKLLIDHTLTKSDLLPTTRNIAALAALHRSISWFVTELQFLRTKSESSSSQLSSNTEPTSSSFTLFTLNSQITTPLITTDELQLPLSSEMALRFQALMKTYEQLSGLILDTIRIEIRCRTMFHIESSMRYGNYSLEGEASEPDPYIADINRELGQCDAFLAKNLPPKEKNYTFIGLGDLMERLLIQYSRLLRTPNTFGIRKLLRNILSLQQSIMTWTNHQGSHFDRAKSYYALFFLSPQEMLDGIREKQVFSFDEYQSMLNLQCGVDPSIPSEGQKTTDRNYSMYVIELHGLELEKSSGS